ncbi:MAG TPA: DNA internalization-related competence protein ComEC/Rec2 [Longimicrobiales bacterium]
MSRALPPLARAALLLLGAVALGLRLPAAQPLPILVPAVGLAAWMLVGAHGGRAASSLAVLAAAGFALGSAGATLAREDCRARLPDGARIAARGAFEARPLPDGTTPFRIEAIRAAGPLAGSANPAARGGPDSAAARLAMPGSPTARPPRPGDAERGWVRCAGTVRVRPPPRAATLPAAGVAVEARGRWWAVPPEGPWPRSPEFAGLLFLDAIHAAPAGEQGRRPLLAARGAAQERLQRLLPRHAALAEALLLAQTGGLDPAVRQRFALSGLTHLLSISGQHVALIAGTLLLLFRILRVRRLAADATAACVIVAYVLFLGAPHAAARAALLLLLALAGRMLQRPADPFALLAAAAIPLVLLDPLAPLDPGFQLSFAGMAGLIALRRRLLDALRPRFGRWLADSLGTSLAATLATAPIAALHFGTVAPVGIVANLVAIPLVAAAVPATALALAASAVAWPAGTFLAGAADLLLGALDGVAGAAASVPGGHAYVPADDVAAWVAAATGAAFLSGWLARVVGGGAARLRRGVRRAVAAGAALAFLFVWPLVASRSGGDALEIHAIDVGQGDAFAIRTPDGRWILVDAGPRTDRHDAGRARVVPYLLRHGTRRVDALILTHPDADHIGGAAAVLDALEVGLVVDPGLPAGKPLYVELLRDAAREDVRWLAARSGRQLRAGDVVLHFLYPDGEADGSLLDGQPAANDFSVVFSLTYGRFAALFMGDAPAAVEERLVARHGDALRADLLKVGHHGSSTSTSEALLAAVEPDIALLSLGRHNRYGHPAPAVIRRLERHGVRILRTDQSGHVTLRVQPDGRVEVETTR